METGKAMAAEVLDRSELLELIRDILAELLNRQALQLTESTTADTVAGWDSLNHVKLLLGLEAELRIRFDVSDIEGLSDVGQLIDVIQKNLRGKS